MTEASFVKCLRPIAETAVTAETEGSTASNVDNVCSLALAVPFAPPGLVRVCIWFQTSDVARRISFALRDCNRHQARLRRDEPRRLHQRRAILQPHCRRSLGPEALGRRALPGQASDGSYCVSALYWPTEQLVASQLARALVWKLDARGLGPSDKGQQ